MERDTKRREIRSYEQKNERESNPYSGIWNVDAMDYLYEVGARFHWESLLESHAQTGAVLDIACGAGEEVEELRELNPERQVVGIDISRAQIANAEQKTLGTLVQGDAEQLPFPDDAFAAVTARAALHHLPNWPQESLAEITRVLEPGGSLVFWEPGKYNPPAAIRRRFFPSDSHTPDETPFDSEQLRSDLSMPFEEVSLEGFYVFSNVYPVLDKYLPFDIPRPLVRTTVSTERTVPGTERLSWILVGHATL